MKMIHDSDMIQHYLVKYQLDNLFAQSQSNSLPLQLRIYKPNELILREGEELDGIYFQVAGKTKVSSSVETGKALLLRFCHPLSVFGDIELIQNVVIQSQVEAVQPTAFLYVNKKTVETELMKDYHFLNELLKHLSYKLQTCTTASRINLLASVEERFASYLLTTHLKNEFGKEMLTPHISEIASLIGTTPRHLNRVIVKLNEMDILRKEKKKLYVLDWERLDELSNGLRYD
ncbi:Crp/Fnr family transcriptional regulator [Paenibacillus sp. SC116]|uniref:Crp/Fnr family transcriptional regulator n=1 Tax=Paenibacillus sp. SC116 TaxID=2968986 RepID=UPI00215B4F3C|nr:Crp/Fnr family transcriptional regulator [Paenibacillus sp. SC116]MCR8842396.1 Crp/Fnr family transcriptional regulator [Paenibacillus sp. SC116]